MTQVEQDSVARGVPGENGLSITAHVNQIARKQFRQHRRDDYRLHRRRDFERLA